MIDRTFIRGRIYTPAGVLASGYLTVDGQGRIAEVGDMHAIHSAEALERAGGDVVDLAGRRLLPGLIDVHVHGGNGFDTMDAVYPSLDGVSRFHAANGTTSFLATTTTASDERIRAALQAAAEAADLGVGGAELLGVHLEGPFINAARRGAQSLAHIRLPDLDLIAKYVKLSREGIRIVTLAPELAEGMETVRWFKSRGVTVSVGHSNATYEEALQAVQAGASHTTHHFNGMSPFHHRDPGVTGAGMLLPEVTTELIADGVHVHPEAVRLLYLLKGPQRICLITDALSVAGLPDGRYAGYEDVILQDGQARLAEDGTLAGSTLTMLQGLINAMKFTGLPLEEMLPSATSVPARQAGVIARKGTLEAGKDADMIVLDEEMRLLSAYVKGRKVYGQA